MPEATATDVRVELDTDLDDPEITDIIERVEREWQRYYGTSDFQDTQHIQDFEAALTALRIAEGRDRRGIDVSTGRSGVEYETAEVESLRKRVSRADPGNEFGLPASLTRDTGRFVDATDQG